MLTLLQELLQERHADARGHDLPYHHTAQLQPVCTYVVALRQHSEHMEHPEGPLVLSPSGRGEGARSFDLTVPAGVVHRYLRACGGLDVRALLQRHHLDAP